MQLFTFFEQYECNPALASIQSGQAISKLHLKIFAPAVGHISVSKLYFKDTVLSRERRRLLQELCCIQPRDDQCRLCKRRSDSSNGVSTSPIMRFDSFYALSVSGSHRHICQFSKLVGPQMSFWPRSIDNVNQSCDESSLKDTKDEGAHA